LVVFYLKQIKTTHKKISEMTYTEVYISLK